MRRMIAAAATVIALGGHAAAQDWPTRPITLIVPFAAGGGIDVSARIQAQRMGELLGQSIVIENVGAAAGMAGGARVAKAAPDGYTLLIGNTGTHAFNQSLYKRPLYNAATKFERSDWCRNRRASWSRARICRRTTCRNSSPT